MSTSPSPTPGPSPDGSGTETRLREALDAMARQVRPPGEAAETYRAVRGDWLRRERRRRLVLAVLVAAVFALAVLIGLWVLNQAPSGSGVIFNDAARGPAVSAPAAPARSAPPGD